MMKNLAGFVRVIDKCLIKEVKYDNFSKIIWSIF